MARLNDTIRNFIVTELACFTRPQEVANKVAEEFGLEITRQQVYDYDPTKSRGDQVAKKWQDLFRQTRDAFIADASSIPIANKSYRLKKLSAMAEKAEQMGNMALAAQLMEQASKECGGMYTNKRELSGPDGGPINAGLTLRFVKPGDKQDDEPPAKPRRKK